jgi:septation ring formation regulator EzrA
MFTMLTDEDLKAIGTIVQKSVEDTLNDHEGVISTKFDAVQEQLDGIETRLTTVERKLDRTDSKVNALVNVMEKKRVITEEEKQMVLA